MAYNQLLAGRSGNMALGGFSFQPGTYNIYQYKDLVICHQYSQTIYYICGTQSVIFGSQAAQFYLTNPSENLHISKFHHQYILYNYQYTHEMTE